MLRYKNTKINETESITLSSNGYLRRNSTSFVEAQPESWKHSNMFGGQNNLDVQT